MGPMEAGNSELSSSETQMETDLPSQTQASLRSKAHLHLVVPQEQSLAVKLREWKDRAEGERSTSRQIPDKSRGRGGAAHALSFSPHVPRPPVK